MNTTDVLLIGVDGGATEVKAHAAACDDLTRPASFELRPESASRVYPRVPEFVPVPLTEQLAQRDADDIRLSATESEQGRLWVQAVSQAVVEVAEHSAARRVLVGIGMPGLKTPDGRGICVINNGPRIADFLTVLEFRLAKAGLELAAPVARLGSDADYCGLGEQCAAEGLFRDVDNAYYVGGGTGLADAMKLRGRLVPFDEAESWIMKAWQIPSALGPTFEKLVSARSLNQVYADLAYASAGALDTADPAVPPGTPDVTADGLREAGRYPELDAARGRPLALAWMDTAALVLAELIFERLCTVKNGRPSAPHRGDAYAKLNPNHEYRGLLLERVIIGQRLGQIYADPVYRAVFRDRLDAYLAALIADSNDAQMSDTYLSSSTGSPSPAQQQSPERKRAGSLAASPSAPALKPGLVCPSRLRAAPALGAAVAAVHALSNARA